MQRMISICGASPICATDPAINTTIYIGGVPPEFGYQGGSMHAQEFYYSQAKDLVDALVNSLPQGTTDQVLILLLNAKATLYRGPGSI